MFTLTELEVISKCVNEALDHQAGDTDPIRGLVDTDLDVLESLSNKLS